MLSSLLLVHKKEACPGAMPLLQTMLKVKEYKAEAAFHLASCANETGSKTLMYHYITQIIKAGDLKYIQKSLDFVQAKLPYDMVETFGRSLHKFVEKEGVDWIVSNSLRDKVTILLSRYGVQSGLYKTALKYSSMVSNDSPLYNQAKFIEGMSLYVLGNQKKSLQVQESLYKSLKKSGSDEEFKSLAAINLARVQFQSGMYHEAINNFKNVSKKHPLWLNSLIERAWSQLLKKDYGGAVGNMYSVQSAFFDDAYKPESHVIKTIGYLRLCQYGDAYNSLKTLNNTYMPWLKKVKNYTDKNKDSRTYYNTVRKYLTSNKDTEIDGLPFPVVLEMTRHGGFIELQKSINRNLDEKDKLASIAGGIDTNRLKYQEFISKNSSNIKKYEIQKIKVSKKIPDSPKILGLEREIDKELYNKDVNQFVLKIHEKNRSLTPSLVSFFSKGMTNTISVFQGKAEKTLHKNLVSIKKDLQKVLTNNEFLKYEVFSGGGENLRFLISGGKSKGRAPASVVTEKQMKWNDNKEVWMDEIGNYKSSLKSNCPKN